MTRLTRTEIRWILTLIANKQQELKTITGLTQGGFDELIKLESANMESLYSKFERLLKDGGKRIAILP